MFSRPEIIVPVDVLQLRSEALARSPGLAAIAFNRNVSRLRQRFVREMATEPGRIAGKVQWQSEKQRRAFFATNGFGRGIPTIRTHALSKGWKTDLKTSAVGGLFTAVNNVPYKRFVQGLQAQRMHINRWKQESEVIPRYQQEAQVILRETWRTVLDETAGVRR